MIREITVIAGLIALGGAANADNERIGPARLEPTNGVKEDIEALRQRLRMAPGWLSGGDEVGAGKISQWWNFFNCSRPGWRNC